MADAPASNGKIGAAENPCIISLNKAMDSPVFWRSLSKILSSLLTNLRNVV
jgi:hypothetical protein